jgi:Amidase
MRATAIRARRRTTLIFPAQQCFWPRLNGPSSQKCLILHFFSLTKALQIKWRNFRPFFKPMDPLPLFVALVVITVSNLLRKMKDFWLRRTELNQWIESARKERDAKVHLVLEMDDISGDEIKLLSASKTRSLIAAGLLDPKKNVIHLAKRCRKYGRDEDAVNGVTEELYDDVGFEQATEPGSVWIVHMLIFSFMLQAYATAVALEKHIEHLDPVEAPPLFGVPVCVKDCVGLKGTLSTGGFACRLNRRDKEDSVIMKVLKEAGAIPICKGNVCQGKGTSTRLLHCNFGIIPQQSIG